MSIVHYVVVTVHVLAAMLWLGGVFFFALVGAPIIRRVEPDALRRELFEKMGVRFRWIGWIAVSVLLVTGVLNLHFRGALRADILLSSPFWGTPYGRSLAVKLVAVFAMLALSAWHDFLLGPSSLLVEEGTEQARAARRKAALVARYTGVAGLIVILAAVRLARGG